VRDHDQGAPDAESPVWLGSGLRHRSSRPK